MRHGQAVQGPDFIPAGEPLVGGAGLLHRPLGEKGDDRVDPRVDAFYLAEVRLHYLGSGELARADRPRQLDGGQEADLGLRHSVLLLRRRHAVFGEEPAFLAPHL